MSEEEKKAIEDLIKEIIILKENSNKIIDSKELLNYKETLLKLITRQKQELEKEKEKNSRYFKQNIEYQKTLEKLQKETIWKDKIKEIIYPTPENYIPLEVQQSEMYKKLLKEVEE